MISIIIPIYNAEKTLASLLNCIRYQDYTDYEVLMIDDGSTDGSEKIAKEFQLLDERFFYFKQENLGVSTARNRGLEKAKGEYVSFLDADDLIDKNYFKELMEICKNVDMAVCDVVVENKGEIVRQFTYDNKIINQTEAINLLLTRKLISSGPAAKLFKKEIIENLSFPLLRAYEDMLFNIEAMSKCDKIAVTTNTKYHYLVNESGTMSTMHRSPSLDIVEATDLIVKFIIKRNDLKPDCLYTTISHLFQYIVAMFENNIEWKFVFKVQKLFRKYIVEICRCREFSYKEKILFCLFAFGWLYQNGKWIKIKDRI